MADGLLQALQALQTTPGETGWGMATTGLAAGLPNMINPYGDRGTNIGVALGGALLTALGAYQARQAAAEQSLEANKLWLGLQGLTPQERLAGIERADNPLIQSKLLDVNTQLEAAALAQQLERNKKIAELEATAEFELGPKGTQLFERKTQGELLRQAAITDAFQKRQQVEDELMRGRALQRKELGLQDVNIPNAIWNRAIEKNASSDLALELAQTIDTYKSIPEFAAATNISAFGDDQLKSRLRNLATIVLQSRSGLAATDRERANLEKILTGDFTAVAPETVSGILKRFAKDEKTIAADTIAAATQRPEAFVSELRKSLEEGRPTQFEPRVPSYGAPVTTETKDAETLQLEQELADLKRLLGQ